MSLWISVRGSDSNNVVAAVGRVCPIQSPISLICEVAGTLSFLRKDGQASLNAPTMASGASRNRKRSQGGASEVRSLPPPRVQLGECDEPSGHLID